LDGGGDFNTIVDGTEKLGGLPVFLFETQYFVQCIINCALNELKSIGSRYTWWIGRIEEACIFERLDRVFGNNILMNLAPESEVHHLIKQGSDHTPLHVRCNYYQEPVSRPFKVLNFWTKHVNFKKIVEENRRNQVEGSLFTIFHTKMRRLKTVLTQWSKETFGKFFQKIATLEDVIKGKEVQLELAPT